MTKWVYGFGGGTAEGAASMKDLLGGKGANLAEMANLGLPVPPGFTITTEVCTHYYANDRTYPAELKSEVEAAWLSLKSQEVVTLADVAQKAGQSPAELLDAVPAKVDALLQRLWAGDFGPRSLDCGHCQFRPVCRVSNRTLHEGEE